MVKLIKIGSYSGVVGFGMVKLIKIGSYSGVVKSSGR